MRWLVLAMLAGCGFHRGVALTGDGSSGTGSADARIDAIVDGLPDVAMVGSDAAICWGNGFIHVCETAAVATKITIGANQMLDTDSQCDTTAIANVSGMCIKIANQVDISHNWNLHGSKPLVIVAEDTITIGGNLDVGSHVGRNIGPGYPSGTCGTNNTPSSNRGGPGGSFGGQGGPGSLGSVTAAAPLPTPTTLRAGCGGTQGGNTGGAGGEGGGAVYLIAGTSITVLSGGGINASGAGATGGPTSNRGGGGGGSGGMIVFDSPAVANAGTIFASGGGGSEGSDSAAGKNGGEATSATSGAAGGGGNTTTGGNGGIGSTGGTIAGGAGDDGSSGAGDGGGGGGAGFILKQGTSITGGGTIAPPAT